jgi:CheY-like chemotaxis protein
MATAFGHEEVIQHLGDLPIDGILVKPIYTASLHAVLRQTLEHQQQPAHEMGNNAPRNVALQSIAGARILLVDDNEFNRYVATELLQSADLVVDAAENGKIALERVQQTHYDAVLMDMQMPIMDGVTATREIRKLPQMSQLPIIAMTANAMQHDKDACLEAGMWCVVTKPISPDELWTALLQWIKPGTQGALPVPNPPAEQPSAAELASDKLRPPAQGDPVAKWQIPELDIAQGLRRVQGKESTYLRMLAIFQRDQKDLKTQLTTALQLQDYGTAERLAHSFKSVAGSLGASTLQALASRLEEALRQRAPTAQLMPMIDSLAQRLDVLMAQLQLHLPAQQAPRTVAVDPVQLHTVITELTRLLAKDDGAAQQLLASHADLLRSALPQDYEQISQLVTNFEFDAALESLGRIHTTSL